MTPIWLMDKSWTPFGDWGLPVRWRAMPQMAAEYSFEEMCKIHKIYRNHTRARQNMFNYWSWFAAARSQRGDFAIGDEFRFEIDVPLMDPRIDYTSPRIIPGHN